MNAWQTTIESVIPRIGWTLVHSLWEAVAIAGLLALVLCLIRNASASRRYVACCLALAATVVSAGVTFALLGESPAVAVRADIVPPVFVGVDQAVRSVALPGPTLKRDAAATDRENILRGVVLVWLAGVVMMTIRQIGGWACLVSMRRGRTLAEFEPVMGRLRTRLNIRRAVRLIETARLDVPAVMGVLRPVIFISLGVLNQLTPQQVEAILAHELAHVRRHDYLVNLLQAAIESLMFYHPAVWWISNSIRAEREHCCDDIARSICGDGTIYAAALATLESRRDRAIGSALAPSSSGGDLLARVWRILNLPPAPRRFSVRSLAVAVLALGCLALPLLMRAQQQKLEQTATDRRAANDQNSHNVDQLRPSAVTQPAQRSFELPGVQKAFPGNEIASEKIDGYGMVTINADKLQPGSSRIAQVHGPITNPKPDLSFFGVRAASPSTQSGFVNVTVSRTDLFYEGRPVNIGQLHKIFDMMPAARRQQTVLTVEAASSDVPVDRYFQAIGALDQIVHEMGFAYLSQIGIHATTQAATVSAAAPTTTQSGEYYMDGHVARTGVYSLTARHKITLKQAIVAAGGVDAGFETSILEVIRRVGDDYYEFRIDDLLNGRVRDIFLQPNDIVRVGSNGKAIPTTRQANLAVPPPESAVGDYFISGEIPRSGEYSLSKRHVTLKQAIIADGGLSRDAKELTITIIRRDDNDKEYIALDHAPANEWMAKEHSDVYLWPNDLIQVTPRVANAPATTRAALDAATTRPATALVTTSPSASELAVLLQRQVNLENEMAILSGKVGTQHPLFPNVRRQLEATNQKIVELADSLTLEQIAAMDPTMREYLKQRDAMMFNVARLARALGTGSRSYTDQKADLDLQNQRIDAYATEYRKHFQGMPLNRDTAKVIPLSEETGGSTVTP